MLVRVELNIHKKKFVKEERNDTNPRLEPDVRNCFAASSFPGVVAVCQHKRVEGSVIC
jgi:hypothetical protein